MKVGDKVVVIDKDGGHGLNVGDLAEVRSVDGDVVIVKRFGDGRLGAAFDHRFSLQNKSEDKPLIRQVTDVVAGINDTYLSEAETSYDQLQASTNGTEIVVTIGDGGEAVWSSENDIFESEEALEKLLKNVLMEKARFFNTVAAEIIAV